MARVLVTGSADAPGQRAARLMVGPTGIGRRPASVGDVPFSA